MRFLLQISSCVRNILLCALCVLGMASCEDFFNSEVPYTGKADDRKLVVNATIQDGRYMRYGLFVSQSYFIFDSAQYVIKADTFYNSNGGYWISYYEEQRSLGLLDDADVTLTIGHNEPIPFSYGREAYWPQKIYPLAISAGDTVRLHVSHPVYGEAFGCQVQPAQISARIADVTFSNFGQVSFLLDIDPYEGAADDVVSISYHFANGNGTVTETAKSLFGNKTSSWPFWAYYGQRTLYSLDPVFSQLPNYQTSSGYYGASAGYYDGAASLYLPASALRDGASLRMIADQHLVTNDPDLTYNVTFDTLQMEVQLMVHTYDDYRYTTSFANMQGQTAVDEPSHIMQTGGNIFDDINEIFSSLGGAEHYLLFGNLSSKDYPNPTSASSDVPDVYGHFTLRSSSVCHYEYERKD